MTIANGETAQESVKSISPEASIMNDVNSDPTFIACRIDGFDSNTLDASGTGSEGNFTAFEDPNFSFFNDPIFVEPVSPFDAPTVEGDLRLSQTSFGLDIGLEPTSPWVFDAAGESRVLSESSNSSVEAVIDLGAFEGGTEVPVTTISLTDDDDSDGIPNGVELAIGTLPAVADLTDSAHLSLTEASSTHANFSFGVNDALQASLILKLTRSTDLVNFNITIATNENTNFTVGSSGIFTINDPNPPTGKAFYRLEVQAR